MLQSETIKIMLEDGCTDGEIPLRDISGNILEMVLKYCNKHVGDKRKVGEMMKGKNVEQVREMFGIVNDFTAEEEAELRDEDRWFQK
ncbi:hypothetical protein FRX31_030743 [Thalictrum thalictroides]|uniref:Skp1-like protein n=1 Tax=Thalictrum thalictroides TaxID=46969 RepID=A0A7J6V4K8_THATH|nr:hypothetical protein FRX31_030743 [Thalictrum thalictroides]